MRQKILKSDIEHRNGNNRSKKRFKNRIGEYETDFTKLHSFEKSGILLFDWFKGTQ
jgi:hypothetical protein